MSKPNPHYEGSFWQHLAQWCRGEYDPLARHLDSQIPDKSIFDDEELHYVHLHLRTRAEEDIQLVDESITRGIGRYSRLYHAIGILLAAVMIALLLWTVSELPAFGDPSAPTNNEVAVRYLEKGLSETGAVNFVTGMILDYRAFDTFGESCVLFAASCCVLILLKVDPEEEPGSQAEEDMQDRHFEPRRDTILQKTALLLVPMIILFGIYIVLNGHISPGGGFSGGAVIGSGLILYLTAFGFRKTERFLNERVVKILTVGALTFYCFAKSYSFYTGANGIHSIITPGTPGAILSGGLIVYLNICVGIVVACTMYSFYVMFRKGGY